MTIYYAQIFNQITVCNKSTGKMETIEIPIKKLRNNIIKQNMPMLRCARAAPGMKMKKK